MTLSSEVVVWVRSSFQVFRCCLCAWLTQTLVVELALRYLCVYSVFFNLKNQVQLRDFFFFRELYPILRQWRYCWHQPIWGGHTCFCVVLLALHMDSVHVRALWSWCKTWTCLVEHCVDIVSEVEERHIKLSYSP